MEPLAGKILGAAERASYFLGNLQFGTRPLFLIDILIVTILLYGIFVFLKETRAMRILYGFIFILALFGVGQALDLVLLNWILKQFTTMLVVAIPIVFQPELRSVLEKMGRSKFLGEGLFYHAETDACIDEIVSATKRLSDMKIGALIAIQQKTGLREYAENGIEIDAIVSSQMLQSIFFPRSPLHDGAVIISGDRIISARSTLPVSDANLNIELGMRHKSGVGVTEGSDAIAVIVSEETGYVSVAVAGKLERRLSEERLRNRLNELIHQKSSKGSESAHT